MSRYVMEMMVRDVNFSSELAKAQAMLQQTTVVTMGLQTAMNALRIGTMAGALSMAALVAPTVLLTTALADYDTSLRRAGAIGGKEFRDNLGSMSTQITNLAIQYGVASDDIAAGVVELTKAGFDYKTITDEMITGIAQLAMVNQESFETTAQIVTYAQSLWGDSVKNSYELMEKMHVAANLSIMDISELGSAFEYAGSSMVLAGVSFDEFLAVIGSLSNIAYTSSENVGTLINRILVNGGDLEEILGLAPGSILSEGRINIRGLMEVLEGLGTKWEITSEVAKLWGVRSVKVFNAVMQTSGNMLDMLDKITSSTGALRDSADFMVDSFDNLIARLKETFFAAFKNEGTMNALRDALISVSSAFASPAFSTAIQEFVKFSAGFVKEEGPGLITTLVEILKTFVSLAPEIRIMALMFKNMIEFISKLDSTVLMLVATFILAGKIFPTQQMLAYGMAVQNSRNMTLSMALSQMQLNKSVSLTGSNLKASAQNMSSYTNSLVAQTSAISNAVSVAKNNTMQTNIYGTQYSGHVASPLYHAQMGGDKYIYGTSSGNLVSGMSLQTTLDANSNLAPNANRYSMDMYSNMMNMRNQEYPSSWSASKYTGGQQMNLGDFNAQTKIDYIRPQTMTSGISGMEKNLEVWALYKNAVTDGKLATEELNVSAETMNEIYAKSNVILEVQDKNLNNVVTRTWDTGKGVAYLQTTTNAAGQSTVVLSDSMLKSGTVMQRYKAGLLGIQSAAVKMMVAQLGMQFAQMGMMAGFMAIVTSESSITKALGAITAALGLLAMASIMVKSVLTPYMIPLILASVGATVALMKVQMDDAKRAANALSDDTTDVGIMPTSTSNSVYSYDENNDGSAIGGKVLSTGWRYIHKNESIIPEEMIADVDNKNNSFRNFMNFLGSVSSYGIKANATVDGGTKTVEKNSHYYDYKTINIYDSNKDDLHRALRSEGLA